MRLEPLIAKKFEMKGSEKSRQSLLDEAMKYGHLELHKEFKNLVFTSDDGSPIYYSNINGAIKDYIAKINVVEIALAKEEKREPQIFKPFTCHTLRHTYATRCYENGVDQQVVQKLLGHSSLVMTTDLYTHVLENRKKEEVAELKILA